MESQHNQEENSRTPNVAEMSPKFSNPIRRFHPASGTGRTVGLILTIVVLCTVGIGSVEGPGTKNFSEVLTTAGIHNTYFESPGTAHEWLTWRRCLNDFRSEALPVRCKPLHFMIR